MKMFHNKKNLLILLLVLSLSLLVLTPSLGQEATVEVTPVEAIQDPVMEATIPVVIQDPVSTQPIIVTTDQSPESDILDVFSNWLPLFFSVMLLISVGAVLVIAVYAIRKLESSIPKDSAQAMYDVANNFADYVEQSFAKLINAAKETQTPVDDTSLLIAKVPIDVLIAEIRRRGGQVVSPSVTTTDSNLFGNPESNPDPGGDVLKGLGASAPPFNLKSPVIPGNDPG